MKAALAGFLACVLAFAATLAAVELAQRGPPAEEEISVGTLTAARMAPLSDREVAARTAERPEWRVGDAWLVRFNPQFSCWIVVGDAGPAGYAQGTSCQGDIPAGAQIAANDYPYVGAFDHDLASTPREGEPIRFYDWPLTDGKTWDTAWFGRRVTVEAVFVESMPGPLGREPGFALTMRDARSGAFLVTYDYVPSLRWWSGFEYASGYAIAVEDAVRGWNGRVVMMEAEERSRIFANVITSGEAHGFQVEQDHDALIVETRASGIHWLEMRVYDPSGDVRASESRADLAANMGYRFTVVEDPEPGTWVAEAVFAGAGSFETRIHALRIDIRHL